MNLTELFATSKQIGQIRERGVGLTSVTLPSGRLAHIHLFRGRGPAIVVFPLNGRDRDPSGSLDEADRAELVRELKDLNVAETVPEDPESTTAAPTQ